MPKELDKNRLRRLKELDELLKAPGKGYSMKQLEEEVGKATNEPVNRFAIKRDIKFLKEQLGMTIIEQPSQYEDTKNGQVRTVKLLKYDSGNESLFHIDLKDDQKEILGVALSMLGLKGITGMFGLGKLKLMVGVKRHSISYTVNPKERKTAATFEKLFLAIKNKRVVSFKLRDRLPPYEKVSHKVSPWYLREYNRRWYLFGWDMTAQSVMHYALDRIQGDIKELPLQPIAPTGSIEQILRDVVGISIPDGETCEVIFWVSDKSADFVSRKPIHHSQEELPEECRSHYPAFFENHKDGKIFKVTCKINYELEREMISFGPELVVLSPDELQEKIKDRLSRMLEAYAGLKS